MGFKKIKILIFLLPIFFLMIFCLVANAQQNQTGGGAVNLENICSDPYSPYYDPEACGDIYNPYYNPDTGLTETQGTSDSFSTFASKVLKFSVVGGALLAVLMITMAGFMYITAAGNSTNITKAKDMIVNAVTGLIIIVSSYLILYTINPDLVSLKLDIPDINITPSGSTTQSSASTNTTTNTNTNLMYQCIEWHMGGGELSCPQNYNKVDTKFCDNCHKPDICCAFKYSQGSSSGGGGVNGSF